MRARFHMKSKKAEEGLAFQHALCVGGPDSGPQVERHALQCAADGRSTLEGSSKRYLQLTFECRVDRAISAAAKECFGRVIECNLDPVRPDNDPPNGHFGARLGSLTGATEHAAKGDTRRLAGREALAQDDDSVPRLDGARRDVHHP